MAELAEVSTEDLMKEVQRRLECQKKPEKRLILVGECFLRHARARDPAVPRESNGDPASA